MLALAQVQTSIRACAPVPLTGASHADTPLSTSSPIQEEGDKKPEEASTATEQSAGSTQDKTVLVSNLVGY